MILAYFSIALLILATVYSATVGLRERPEAETSSWIFPAGAKRPARIAVGLATLLVVVGVCAWLGPSARHTMRRSLCFVIPEGFTGWVRVEFEVPGAAALPVQEGQYVLAIGPDGALKTSSLEQYGWAKDAYYFRSADGLHAIPDQGPECRIWGKINGEAGGVSGKRKYEEFFVGTAQQFKGQVKEDKKDTPYPSR